VATKKSVKQALKYTLGSEQAKCGSCREEVAMFLKDLGLAMRDNVEQSFTIRTHGGHIEYKQAYDTHSGPPAKKEKKSEAPEEIEPEEEA